MTTTSQKVLLDSIKASLFGTTFSYPDDTNWTEVIEEAKAQAVMGLICPVIPINDESSDQSKAYYMRILYEQNQLLKLLDDNNIPCVIIKGCAAAMYYPKPYLRSMGDVDILIPHDRLDDAMMLMESNGYIYTHGKDKDGKPIEDARHIEYVKNGIDFELHHHFSSRGFNIDNYLEKAIDKREYRVLTGYRIPVLPELQNGLVLLGHIHQHLTLDHLGLRQIIDWEMFCHSMMGTERLEKEFYPLAKGIGLLELAVNVTRMCEKYLGLPHMTKTIKQYDYAEEAADILLSELLTSGNFGKRLDQLPKSSGERIRSAIGIIKNKGLYSYFQDNGLKTWDLCHKHPTLKSFAFIYGFLRFCVRGIKSIVKTGKYVEQYKYVKNKREFDRNLGIRMVEKENKWNGKS